jgi:Carboxypeptidase regulatory-like domain
MEEMMLKKRMTVFFLLVVGFVVSPGVVRAQSAGSSGSIVGTVADPSGAVVANATVEIHNPVSGYDNSAVTDTSGNFNFTNIPFNPYHMTVKAKGFDSYVQDVDIRSGVPLTISISLKVAGSATTVTVEGGGDLLENDPTDHTDVDRGLFDKLPLESQSSSLSSLVTLA